MWSSKTFVYVKQFHWNSPKKGSPKKLKGWQIMACIGSKQASSCDFPAVFLMTISESLYMYLQHFTFYYHQGRIVHVYININIECLGSGKRNIALFAAQSVCSFMFLITCIGRCSNQLQMFDRLQDTTKYYCIMLKMEIHVCQTRAQMLIHQIRISE